MSRRTLWTVVVVVVVAALAIGAYWWNRRMTAAARPRGDPAVGAAAALVALARAPQLAAVRLTPEQIDRVLPLLRVLRDTDPNDGDAIAALVRDIRSVLTPEQVKALEEMRERVRQRAQEGEQPRRRRPPLAGEGDPRARLTELRRRALDRAIRALEAVRRGAAGAGVAAVR